MNSAESIDAANRRPINREEKQQIKDPSKQIEKAQMKTRYRKNQQELDILWKIFK